jgi:hypothetical protein
MAVYPLLIYPSIIITWIDPRQPTYYELQQYDFTVSSNNRMLMLCVCSVCINAARHTHTHACMACAHVCMYVSMHCLLAAGSTHRQA